MLTPEQRLKRELLTIARDINPELFRFRNRDLAGADAIEGAWRDSLDNDEAADLLREVEEEFRCGDFRTGLPTQTSRHYEAEEVAARLRDGTWLGWTHWFGGGKHGEPESIPWMEDAYELECSEAEKVVLVRTFTKKKGLAECG